MLTLLSPSKKLDEKSTFPNAPLTNPVFEAETEVLVNLMKAKTENDIQSLMKLSDTLSALNFERYQSFTFPLTEKNSRPALYTFKGDVYDKMDVATYTVEDLNFAQKHLRILSGLYGVLKPLDLMQPYRLEMGTKLQNEKGKDLYQFWQDNLTEYLDSYPYETIVNLASTEYSKAVHLKKLSKNVVTIDFKHLKNGQLKTIGLLAKRARGLMANYIVKNKIDDVKQLKHFAEDGYVFIPKSSTDERYVFVLDTDK